MGHSQSEKTNNHDRIVEVAAELIRERGVDGPGVAEIMQAAGLTHGGFYKHFGSRDDLVAEAVTHALAENEQAVLEVTDHARSALRAFVDWYASAEHRDDPAHGCTVAALGADAARAGGAVQAAYAAQVDRYLAHLQVLLGGQRTRARAVTSLAALVGALYLARAVGEGPLSDELLADVRAAVKRQAF